MIVFLDQDNQTATICDKTIETISFSDIVKIRKMLQGKNITYVTEAIKASGDDVIALIESVSQKSSSSKKPVNKTDARLFVHPVKNRAVNFPEFKGKVHGFESIIDFRLLDDYDTEFLDSQYFKQAIDKGIIEIVDGDQRGKILLSHMQKMEEKERKEQKTNSIIADSKEDAFRAIENSAGLDAERIDLDADEEEAYISDSIEIDAEE